MSSNDVVTDLGGSYTCPTCRGARSSLEVSKMRYEEAIQELKAAKNLYEDAKASLEKENISLKDSKLILETENSKLMVDKEKVENELKETSRELENVKKENKSLSDFSPEQLQKRAEYENFISSMGVKRGNPIVFLDMKVRGVPAGRIVMELYADVVPRLAEIFRKLCTGEMLLPGTNRLIGCKGTDITFFSSKYHICGGNVKVNNADEFKSIYGDFSNAEMAFTLHRKPGDVFASNTYSPVTYSFVINGSVGSPVIREHPLIGRVVQGIEVVDGVNSGLTYGYPPQGTFVIEECGQLF